MSPKKLALATRFLAIAFLVGACGGDFTIDDFSDSITVTNASTSQAALVLLLTSQTHGQMVLAAGESRTFTSILAAEYTIEVAAEGGEAPADYVKSLRELRDELVDLSLNPGYSTATPENVLTELVTVQTALHQLESSGLQTCSHAIVTGANSHATMKWVSSGGIGSLWELSCN